MTTVTARTAVLNLRDLGGLPTHSGGVTRAGLLLRSATLQDATDTERDALSRSLRGGLIVDLRAREEAVSEGHLQLPGVRYCNIPLQNVDASSGAPGDRLGTMYRSIVDEHTRAAVAINHIGASLPNPCLIHCAAGKDRTGVITALVLGIAGVQTASIMADYVRTTDALPKLMAHLSTKPRYKTHMTVLPRELYEVSAAAMESMVTLVETQYGGFTTWARQAGVRAEVIDAIKSELIFPPQR